MPATGPATRGLLLRGAGGSRQGFALPFDFGPVGKGFVLPNSILSLPQAAPVQLPFTIAGNAQRAFVLPNSILGPAHLSAALPFNILDGTIGLDDNGAIIVPLFGWYDVTEAGG